MSEASKGDLGKTTATIVANDATYSLDLANPLGKGGFGTVYKAINRETGDFVAVKQIKLQNMPRDQLSSIMGEIDLLKKLRHPNIVKYLGYSRTQQHLNIFLEFIESGSLASILKKFGSFPEVLVARYIIQVLNGLNYLHEQGVVHRDIKGANLLTTKDGTIKLADFGVATKLGEASGAMADAGSSVVGSPYWMAPEVIEMRPPTTKSDIWSLACTVIELVSGAPPYFDLQPMPALFRIVQDDCPPLPAGISAALRDFLMQCFVKEPHLRVSAAALLRHAWLAQASRAGATPLADPLAQPAAPRLAEPARPPALPAGDDEGDDWDADFADAPRPSLERPAAALRASSPGSPSPSPSDSGAWDLDSPLASSPPAAPSALQASRPRAASRSRPAPAGQQQARPAEPQAPTPPSPSFTPSPRGRTATAAAAAEPNSPRGGPLRALSAFAESEESEDWDRDLAFGFEAGETRTLRLPMTGASSSNTTLAASASASSEAEDPFAEFDVEPEDPAAAALREQQARLTQDMLRHMRQLQLAQEQQPQQPQREAPLLPGEPRGGADDTEEQQQLVEACQELERILRDHPQLHGEFVRRHGAYLLLEGLAREAARPDSRLLAALVRLASEVGQASPALLEDLCLLGLLPCLLRVLPRAARPLRAELARFVRAACSASALSLQTFVACGGAQALASLLASEYEQSRDLVWLAVDCIALVFQLQGHTPKNDFARLFAKEGVAPRLVQVLGHALRDLEARAEDLDRLLQLLLQFGQADARVKLSLCSLSCLRRLLRLLDRVTAPQLARLLKLLKLLSMEAATLTRLERAGAIPRLVALLAAPPPAAAGSAQALAEQQNQILTCLYNLCRLDRSRQEQAALAGLVPHLQRLIRTRSPLRQFALPILCDLAHAPRARPVLVQNDILRLYLDLLRDEYWHSPALDSIAAWLAEPSEAERLRETLLGKEALAALLYAFSHASLFSFPSVISSLLRLLELCPELARALGKAGLLEQVVSRLRQPDPQGQLAPQARVALVRTLRVLFDALPQQERPTLVRRLALRELAEVLAADRVVFVQDLAAALLSSF